MQLVTPRLVAMAVRMAMAVWMINFQVSFLFADMIGDDFFESLMKMMNSSYAPLRASGRGASAVLGGRGLEFVAVGQADDVVLAHVLVEHLVDVGEAHLALHALHQLVVCRALLARGLRGAVGVEPGRADHLACGKLRLLRLLLLRGRSLVGIGDLGQVDLVARTVGGEVVARLVAILAADALDDIDRDDFCHSFFF